MIAVFDTNIVIDALNGVTEADVEYSRYEHVLISRITWMEVLIGVEGDDSDIRDFLESHNDAVLVTRNTKDFNPGWDGIHLPYII